MPGDHFNRSLTDTDLDQAWQDRWKDAEALHENGRHPAAMAAMLYALEIYLKFRVCQRLKLANPLRKLEIHDIELLLVYAGFSSDLGSLQQQSNIRQNWDRIVDLATKLNDLRYLPASRWTEQQSSDLLRCLNDPQEGVLTWLKTLT